MKVLHMISGGDSGGAKTHVYALMDELVKIADVKIVCFTDGDFFKDLKYKNVKYELLQQKSRFDMSVVSRLAAMVREEGYDVIHSHGARANFIARSLKKKVSVPVVTTVHSDYLLDFDGIYKKIFYTFLNVISLKKMDYYIGVSTPFKDMLIERGFRPNSIYTVYNGMNFDKEIKFDSKEDFAKRIGITRSPDDFYVGIIGRHEFVKGHDVFIRAAKEVLDKKPNVKFLIAGDGENREALCRLAAELGIEDKIIFTGFIKDIYSFINFIDINVLSSRCESFPYVLLEGALMKKATISSAVGGIPDLIKNGKTGLLFENEDSSGLAKCILTLAEDDEKRQSLGEALYEYASSNFSDKSLAQSHFDIYSAILRDRAEKKKYDAVLSGYYGFNNSGDDALLFAICENLKRVIPDIRLLVLSAKPAETEKIYRVDAKRRFNILSVCLALRKSKMLINGGGSLIQDATSSKSLWYYLFVMNEAKRRGLKVYIYANGIGPIKDKNKKLAAKAIEKADMITLRDENSVDELAQMNIQNKNVLVTADPAITLKGVGREQAFELLSANGIPCDKEFLAISVRQWAKSDRQLEEKLASAIDEIAEKYSLTPLFIPMKLQTDYKSSALVASLMKTPSYILDSDYSVDEIMGIVGEAELVISMRLHTLIYAAGNATPVVGVVYDPKVQGFMEYIGQNRCVDADNLSKEQLIAHVDDIMQNRDEIKKELTIKANELADKAMKNAVLAAELLREQ
ncbi:MAG: polysaccharide pyruvyl transferase CsaB [Clostridia bacterium]|nr:polysaccharide pyruvyl transferase CsaB [Clostridia bacterium]